MSMLALMALWLISHLNNFSWRNMKRCRLRKYVQNIMVHGSFSVIDCIRVTQSESSGKVQKVFLLGETTTRSS